MGVEIFKTDITKRSSAKKIEQLLLNRFPDSKINFDLEDCDNILRIETKSIVVQQIEQLVNNQGHYCQVLY
ncbi:MAG: hypothetical protein R2802_02745 [Flavobacteriaceae bacterium]|nr:hypothetical protein [Mangrovimonas sp.]